MRCAEQSTRIGETLAGTATSSDFWLVVEQPGPYAGREAMLSSGFPADLGARLLDAVAGRGGKVLLARAPGRHPRDHVAARRVWWCWAGYPRPTVWTARVADPAILETSLAGDPTTAPVPSAHRSAGPVVLVCTHGRRDACCARSARGLLANTQPTAGEIWESSHQGGHRFAPVVLELTTGYQHGRVTRADLTGIAAAAARDEIHLPTARGHVGLSAAQQAVDLAVRRAFRITALDGLRSVSGDGAIAAEDRHGRRFIATVTEQPLSMRPESCGGQPAIAANLDVVFAESTPPPQVG